ncbi:MAG: amino acid adenylation domain-containing protein [Caldilineaceae bacterium]|nr:amino acid adenylation domain-containing protein [Caldilineaceae bacterium]
MSSFAQTIAVLGFACRFPGADSPEAFWQNLAAGVESIQAIPPTRWAAEHFFVPPPHQPGKSISQWGGFLADIQRFDAAFFGIAPAEAAVMDPQQRILLELAHETLTRSGYDDQQRTTRQPPLRVGVFLGIGQNGYAELTVPLLRSGQPTHPMLVAHNIRNLVAGQIAHSLNLTGPALVIDTACSSSLVALHVARQSLLAGDCDLALVGGINLNITPTPFVAFSSAGVLAPSPHTYVFDERADGFVLGEGGGMLLLSTLERATAAQDPVLGLIRGSAINNDGRSLGAITPSPRGQRAVLHAAYTNAEIPPASITYLEAHGTATRIGDLVEARALTRFFATLPMSGPRYLGSVKPNVGHLLSAAAMPSLIKVLLALHHRQLPPTLHGEEPRASLNLAQAGLTINRTLVDWQPAAPDQPLRAGISSFGFGGTNAHVILEEAPATTVPARAAPPHHFAHTPFWLTDNRARPAPARLPASTQPITTTVIPPSSTPPVHHLLQRVTWQPAPLPESEAAQPCLQWLLLTVATPAAQQVAQLLRRQLEAQGAHCTTQLCTPAGSEALDYLLAQIDAATGIIVIGPMGQPPGLITKAALDHTLEHGLFTLHTIGQRLLTMTARPRGCWIFTAGAYAIPQAPLPIAPERAAFASLALALQAEDKTLACQVVDLPPTDDFARLIPLLIATLEAAPQPGNAAWRTLDRQWVRLTRQLTVITGVEQPEAEQPTPYQPKPTGLYLITGGATGIGAALARSLAAQGATLLLVGRTPVTRSPERAALLIELRQQGAKVDYLVADITQPDEVTALVDYACQLYGTVTGVIHAAGVVAPRAWRHKERTELATVLAPKMMGAWLLAQALQRRAIQPDCFVLCSSLTAVMPDLSGGLSDYAAANAFLDALAAHERARGIACTALNWSLWTETGMGAHPALRQQVATQGVVGLSTAEGVAAFYQAVGRGEAQIVIGKPPVAANAMPTSLAANHAPPTVSSPPMTTHNLHEVEETLQRLLAAALKVEPATIAPTASFMALGIDSMDALDLVQKLEQAGFHGLPATLFFEYQTIADLARYLAQQRDAPATQPAVSEHTSEPAPAAEIYHLPLHATQRAFAIQHRLDPERPAVAFLRQSIQGELQPERLQQAIAQVAHRHPLLRARFTSSQPSEDALQQTIYPTTTPALLPTLALAPPIANRAALLALEEEIVNEPFDLAQAPPWRLLLTRAEDQPDRWHLLLALHHIVGDAWSLAVIAQELWIVYTALSQGAPARLTMVPPRFPNHLAEPPKSPTPATVAWWRQQLTTYATARQQPSAPRHAPSEEETPVHHAAHPFQLTVAQTAALRQVAAAQQLSLFHLLLALYFRALQQVSGQAYLVVNVADAQRSFQLPDLRHLVGSFADTLPVGLAVEEGETAVALATRLRQLWLAIQPHKAISSVDLAHLWATIDPAAAPQPLSTLGFSFARFPAELPPACPLTVVEIFGRTATPATHLSLVGWEFADALHFAWNYLAPFHTPATVTTLAAAFAQAVAQVIAKATPNHASGIDAHPADFVPLHEQFQAQCRRTPTAIAVWEPTHALTYTALDQQANQVAAALQAAGIAPGDTVGLLADPSTAAVILLLGIAKTGAAWVPLDPAHPARRHAEQLQQAATRRVLYPASLSATAAQLQQAAGQTLQPLSLEAISQTPVSPLTTVSVTAEQIAYLIFTSGSTGSPKGVPITQGALHHYLHWAIATFGYGPTDRVMQATSLGFDAAMRQLWAPLLTGGTVIPVSRVQLQDPAALLAFVQASQITLWSSVPALWARLLDLIEQQVANGLPAPALSQLRWIQLGGEALSAQLVRRWYDCYPEQSSGQPQFVNLYGPTESTINASYYVVPGRPAEEESQIPIGYPAAGAILRVVDEEGEAVAPDTVGELWIGGVGLSPGYVEDAERTQARFVHTATGERFYRSGDRVVARANGALLFCGRVDDQVKVRGYRVELGELEATLAQHPAIRLAAVSLCEEDDTQYLVAYLECRGAPPTENTLRHWLQQRLPAYMIPHQYYWLERLPQLPNGKLDRQQLQTAEALSRHSLPNQPPDRATPSVAQNAPQSATERQVARLWQQVLRRDPNAAVITREDDFFALGGDSLQAIQLFVELGKERRGLPRAAYLYRYRTVAALAHALDHYQPAPSPTVPPATGSAQPPAEESFAVSLAQAGFLLLRAWQADQTTSWCAQFWLVGSLELPLFQQAVQQLVERHLMLRVIFPPAANGKTPQQRVIQPSQPLPVYWQDWQALPRAEQQAALAAHWQQLRQRRFDPAQWPLLEFHLCRLSPTHHSCFVATDHLIGDGVSGWLLGQELIQIYEALAQGHLPALPPLRSTFRDYVAWQEEQAHYPDPVSEAYWRQCFATPYQAPPLRAKRLATAPSDQATTQAHQRLAFAAPLVQKLDRYAGEVGVTLYELLLTLFLRQLRQLTGQSDLVVGSALSGRDEPLPDIMQIVGPFATVLPLRIQLPVAALRDEAQQVAAAFATARAHTLPPRRIAQLLPPQTTFPAAIGAQFLFSYMDFTPLGTLDGELLQVDWSRSQSELHPPTLSADLLLTGRKVAGELRLDFTAPTPALRAADLLAFAEHFQQTIQALTTALPEEGQVRAPATAPVQRSPHSAPQPLAVTAHGHSPPPLDAALIGYLPPFSQIQQTVGLDTQQWDAHRLRQLLFPSQQPQWLERLETPLGRSGMIAIPWFADELTAMPKPALYRDIQAAIHLATTLGARCVSLAGMLPAHTRYGYALIDGAQPANSPPLTTGHSTTVVAVVQSVLAALAATKRPLAAQTVGCLGLGSIGSAALQLLLKVADHPAELLLCDVAGSGPRLQTFVATLRRELDYQGQVHIIEVEKTLPTAFYRATVILGATSRPQVLAVAQLAPGTLVIDDSFPPCFALDQALARMTTAQDVLLVGGGLLACGPSQRTVYLPGPHAALGERIAQQLLPDTIAGCQLEALLWANQPTLPLTQGMANLPNALAYWQAAQNAGLCAAPLHLQEWRVTATLTQQLQRFASPI